MLVNPQDFVNKSPSLPEINKRNHHRSFPVSIIQRQEKEKRQILARQEKVSGELTEVSTNISSSPLVIESTTLQGPNRRKQQNVEQNPTTINDRHDRPDRPDPDPFLSRTFIMTLIPILVIVLSAFFIYKNRQKKPPATTATVPASATSSIVAPTGLPADNASCRKPSGDNLSCNNSHTNNDYGLLVKSPNNQNQTANTNSRTSAAAVASAASAASAATPTCPSPWGGGYDLDNPMSPSGCSPAQYNFEVASRTSRNSGVEMSQRNYLNTVLDMRLKAGGTPMFGRKSNDLGRLSRDTGASGSHDATLSVESVSQQKE